MKVSQLRDIICESIMKALVEGLDERGTNLSSLYHFTDMGGLRGIVSSGKFKLSGLQSDIRGGKNYMSFTRHKSPFEGYAVPSQSFIRVEISGEALNSIHNKSIGSYEYYSPVNHWRLFCDPWSNMVSDTGDNSAKAAYAQFNKTIGKEPDGEYLNQAEESLTSNDGFIDAVRAIKRIDICIDFPDGYCNGYMSWLRGEFFTIYNSEYSPLYDKIFIYDNMRDFALQTDNCIPISKCSMEDFDRALFKGKVKPVAESIDEEGIHIKEKNKGKFTATKKRTGKSTEELTHSKNPLTRKRAIFAQNAKKWHKGK